MSEQHEIGLAGTTLNVATIDGELPGTVPFAFLPVPAIQAAIEERRELWGRFWKAVRKARLSIPRFQTGWPPSK